MYETESPAGLGDQSCCNASLKPRKWKFIPRVDDDIVLWDNPDNESYERYMRKHNIRIPGQESNEVEKAQLITMAMNLWCEALKLVAEQNRKLTDEYRQMIRESDDKFPKKLQNAEANVSRSKKSNSGKPSLETLWSDYVQD